MHFCKDTAKLEPHYTLEYQIQTLLLFLSWSRHIAPAYIYCNGP